MFANFLALLVYAHRAPLNSIVHASLGHGESSSCNNHFVRGARVLKRFAAVQRYVVEFIKSTPRNF